MTVIAASRFADVIDVVAVPKVAPADSFVLHAPLELLARHELLHDVAPDARPAAGEQLTRLARSFAEAGEPVDAPRRRSFASPEDAAWRLTGAIAAGDLDDVDEAAAALAGMVTPLQLSRLLAQPIVTSLAAAAHASILLDLLPRAAHPAATALLRGPARELARHADWQLHWFEDPDDAVVVGSLADALLDVPPLGVPSSAFIQPIMRQAEDSGLAHRLLGGLPGRDVGAVRIELARIAAWSMLQEPPDHAPYGWTHCLTMPQAVMALAEAGTYARPDVAVAVASTYVVGFRAALGQVGLVGGFDPDRPASGDLDQALATGTSDAAAWVHHAPVAELANVRRELATRAALHEDAHLVKYTLACFDASARDPEAMRLYLAACAALHAWWMAHDREPAGR